MILEGKGDTLVVVMDQSDGPREWLGEYHLSRTVRAQGKALFAKAIIQWLQGTEWEVGLTGEGIDLGDVEEFLRSVVPAACEMLRLGQVGALATEVLSPADAHKVTRTLIPFTDLADILGLKSDGSRLMGVVFADNLTIEEVVERIDLFRQFGPSLRDLRGILYRKSPTATIPVFVYFDSDHCIKVSSAIDREALLLEDWNRDTAVYPYFVNVVGGEVTRKEHVLGEEWPWIFSDDDLEQVHALMKIYDHKEKDQRTQ